MRWKPHVRFGGRARETYQPRGWHRALVRPHLANEAIDKTRRWAWNVHRYLGLRSSRWVKRTRWALLKDPDRLKDSQLAVLWELRRSRSVLYRCWQLKEGVRDLFRLAHPADAPTHLDWWLAWACRSRIPALVTLSKTVRANRDRILAAVELGLSNSKLEGLNSKIRLINHRGYGHHSAAAVIAMFYLCCSGITIELPLRCPAPRTPVRPREASEPLFATEPGRSHLSHMPSLAGLRKSAGRRGAWTRCCARSPPTGRRSVSSADARAFPAGGVNVEGGEDAGLQRRSTADDLDGPLAGGEGDGAYAVELAQRPLGTEALPGQVGIPGIGRPQRPGPSAPRSQSEHMHATCSYSALGPLPDRPPVQGSP